jgi:hypothetical protein
MVADRQVQVRTIPRHDQGTERLVKAHLQKERHLVSERQSHRLRHNLVPLEGKCVEYTSLYM